MRLTKLIEGTDIDVTHGQNIELTEVAGLTADSRAVESGYLFAALPGVALDGREFIDDAVGRGAVAILAPEGTSVAELAGGALITAANPRQQYAKLAANFYGAQPAHLTAVTGTNGKTSVAEFGRQIWAAHGYAAASIGTLGIVATDTQIGGGLTTPDPVDLHRSLSDLKAQGIDHAVLEASSHGLDQFRLDGTRLNAAGFTNLSRDHLDYHKNMSSYLDAKLRLFTELLAPGSTVVLNADDAVYGDIVAALDGAGHTIVSYGREGRDYAISGITSHRNGLRVSLDVAGRVQEIELPLAGSFQAMNAICALALIVADGGDLETGIAALPNLTGVPGRLELVGHANGGTIYVDYAHTPDALTTVLAALRPHTEGKLIAVIGCGGDRDQGKREPMGAAAAELADQVIVTDDNPRNEEPAAIRAAVMRGCPDAREIGDRRDAIAAALELLGAEDIVVIAGKGHEQGQIVGDQIQPFSDVAVVQELIAGGVAQ